jgi:uncharacterized protein
MIKHINSVKIGSLWNEGRGATFKDEIEATPKLEEIKLLTPLTASLLMVRMKDSIMAIAENINTTCELACTKCLDTFEQQVTIASTEREYLENMPEKGYDPFEIFLIDREHMSVDLTELFRQEIILHFPMIPVCSKGCRGLCPGCRINLNHTSKHLPDCTREDHESVQHKPFAQLKELFNSSKK